MFDPFGSWYILKLVVLDTGVTPVLPANTTWTLIFLSSPKTVTCPNSVWGVKSPLEDVILLPVGPKVKGTEKSAKIYFLVQTPNPTGSAPSKSYILTVTL